MKTSRPDSIPSRRWPFRLAAATAALLASSGLASAGLVLEVNPGDYNATTKQWPIANGSILGGGGAGSDYFQGSSAAVALTSIINADNGLGYKAVDFTAGASIFGGPLCPSTLGGANAKTIEAWCYQPTNANGDAMTILCLSRLNCATDGTYALVNSFNNRSVYSNPHVVGWNASNAARSGKWVHLVASYDGTTLRCYVNGAPDKVDTYTYNTEAGGSMTIGMMRWSTAPVTTPHSTASGDGWNSWRGYLGSIRVYDEARTAEQIASDYAGGVNYGEAGVPLPKITSSVSGTGGNISPLGVTNLAPHTNQTYTITPNLGYELSDIVVDGDDTVPLASSYTFSDVTADHTIVVSFTELPKQTVSGKVTDGTTGVSGATVYFKTSANASASPTFTTTTDASGNYTQILPPAIWYVTASEIHYFTPADATFTVASSPLTLDDIALTANPNWKVIFSLNTDAFSGIADGARITSWTCALPVGSSMPAFSTYNNGLAELGPVVQTIDAIKWEKNVRAVYSDNPPPTVHIRQDGFQLGGNYLAPIQANGASVVTVVKPERKAVSDAYNSIANVFYNKLGLGIRNDNGKLIVQRGGDLFTGPAIPDGQKTILSLVVQPTGQFKVFANGLEVMNTTTTRDMSALTPGSADHEKRIRVGRAADDWSVFNGNIADTSVFKVALSGAERSTLESDLSTKFGIPLSHTITATAGAGGTIDPTGSVTVTEGTDKTFTIAAVSGFAVSDVLVDGVSIGATTSYTFTNVLVDHTIAASFVEATGGDHTITASAGAGGTIDPTGAVTVPDGTDKTFTITANAAYVLADVLVDGVSNPAAVLASSHTFTGVVIDHTIAASFITTFASWAKSKGLDGSPGKEAGAGDDPDKDGRPNLQEFAFNGNPLSGADNGQVHMFTKDVAGDTAKELVLTIAVRETATAFAGTPSPSLSVDGITYIIEGSNDLSSFLTQVDELAIPVTDGLGAAGDGYQYRSFRLQGSVGAPVKGFLRAKVTMP